MFGFSKLVPHNLPTEEQMTKNINDLTRPLEEFKLSMAMIEELEKRGVKVAQKIKNETALLEECEIATFYCGDATLDNIIDNTYKIDAKSFESKPKDIYHLDLQAQAISEHVLRIALELKQPFHSDNETKEITLFNGSYYEPIKTGNFEVFAVSVSIKSGLLMKASKCDAFLVKFQKEFSRQVLLQNRDIVYLDDVVHLNFKNGLLIFDKDGNESFITQDRHKYYTRYCLPYSFNPNAVGVLWLKFLKETFSDNLDKIECLKECLALPFYRGFAKTEKFPIFLGEPLTGKSTCLDVYEGAIGKNNISHKTLESITTPGSAGNFERMGLDGKLANIIYDSSMKFNDAGLLKTIISRQPIDACLKYKDAKTIRNYAQLMCAMNELPSRFVTDAALRRRALIIRFNNQISEADEISTLADDILEKESAVVMNFILDGLRTLIKNKGIRIPDSLKKEQTEIHQEIDVIAAWASACEAKLHASKWIRITDLVSEINEFSVKGMHRIFVNPKMVCARLRGLGFVVKNLNHTVSNVAFMERTKLNYLN